MHPEHSRRRRRIAVALSVVLALAAIVAGFLAGMPADVAPVHAAQCKSANAYCVSGTETSALTVSHHTSPSYAGTSTVVEPDDGESWSITAYWNTMWPPLPCTQLTETAYAPVSWDGSSWVTSNVTLTNNIVDISVCQGSTCDAGGGSTHAWEYKLIVELNDPIRVGLGPWHNLRSVVYTTTSIDDGYTIEDPTETQGDCYTDASVSPTSQTFGATDALAYWSRCNHNCSVSGVSTTILYD